MTPQTNDAYNGTLRDIVFPAGILQPPMFDSNADPAINYGAIGGVIGHELTHGFDDQGRKIDAIGALRDWWTEEDANTFEARAKVLGAQYSKFEPLPGVHVNGDLTMGENIADLGGLTLALDAYRASLKGQPAPVLDGFTGDQRVFLGWAQAWRGKVTDDFVKSRSSAIRTPRANIASLVVLEPDSGTTRSKSSPPTDCTSRPSSACVFGDSRRLQSAVGKLHSAVLFGGIAQLVERQLCKLEVRGSNPLASRRREDFRACRAVALA